jgi:diguanylate cyclase (GGDEF)-like protein/PAS domain S-box-containing protein
MSKKRVPFQEKLRAEAEAKLAGTPPVSPFDRSLDDLVHELQVHQIELHMQNEALRQAQIALEESRDRYVDLYEFAPVGYLTLDSGGLIAEINLTGATMLGRERHLLVGTRFVRHVVESDRDRWHRFFVEAQKGRARSSLDLAMQRGNGIGFHARVECMAAGETSVRVVLSDITERKRAEDEIHRLAFYDPLTGLPNRRLLQDRLGQALAVSKRSRRYGALLFLDLDNFKTLNDTRGHDAGDKLLVEAARRIGVNLRAGDTVARLGGDEFVVILEELSAEIHDAAVQTREVGEKIRETLSESYLLAGREFHCAASLGITLFFGQEESVETLLKHADLAMYKAKDAGRNTLRFFDPAMQVALDERSALEADLRVAAEAGQLRLHYQPQVDSAGRVIGAEALLRWEHPQRGIVMPDSFIPLAEETSLILPIGEWVLTSACAQLKAWASDPATCGLKLAVNVSARQFRQSGFVDQVRTILTRTGANPQRLKLELTESLVLDDVGDTFEKMHALKALGVGFALDDFGTGSSSLSYLTRLPLDQLKIDRSFVFKLPASKSDSIIAQTIVTMGRSLGLDVIAEGVETELQREFLQRNGCTAYQGYLFGRPLAPDEFNRYLLAV